MTTNFLGSLDVMETTEHDYGMEAQQAAEKHLVACWEAMWCVENDECEIEHPEGEHPNPACGPFCGCDTCQVREVLHAAWPIIERYARENPP